MIRYLKGKIVDIEEKGLVIEAGNVGYLVLCLNKIKQNSILNSEIEFYCSFIVRETSQEIFGFSTKQERSLFELLITISGIGPKTGLAILELDSAESLFKAISENNITYLTQVSGIGKKVAEKIILELKDKIKNLDFDFQADNNMNIDLIEALIAMGYSKEQSKNAIKDIPFNTATEESLKLALKILNNKN